MVKGIPIISTTISTIQKRRVPIYNNYRSNTPSSTESNETELEARVRALENRAYDDSDIKSKMGYDDIPEGESLMSQINDLKEPQVTTQQEI